MADQEKAPWDTPLAPEEKAPWHPEPSTAQAGFSRAGRMPDQNLHPMEAFGKAVDYTSAPFRMALEKMISPAPGKEDQGLSLKEVKDWATFNKEAPQLGDYLQRIGKLDDSSLSKVFPSVYAKKGMDAWYQPTEGGPLDVTKKGAYNFAGGLIGPAVLEAPAGSLMKAVTRPATTVTTPLAKKLFESGLKDVNYAGQMAGKGEKAASDLLWKNNIGGSASSIAEQAAGLAEKKLAERNALLSLAKERGAKIDPVNSLNGALEYASQLKKDPITQKAGEDLENLIQSYWEKGPIDPEMASAFKTTNSQAAGNRAYNAATNAVPSAKARAHKTLAGDLQKATESAVDAAVPESEGVLKATNADLGTLLSTAKKMGTEGLKGDKKNAITSVDALLGAGGLIAHASPQTMGAGLALKKAADLSKSARFRTGVGITTKQINEGRYLYPLIKAGIIEETAPKPEVAPWMQLNPDQE